MKRKLLLILLLICPFFVNACSCDKFDINTYTSAVKNYENSTGLDYKLTVTTITEGADTYMLEESRNKYKLSTTRKVENFYSTLSKYEVTTNNLTGNGAPQWVYSLNRYYVGETNSFYTNEIANVNNKQIENKSYEEKYDEKSVYHINNIVPTYSADNISNFNIVEDESNKKASIVTFEAECPTFVECSKKANYKIYINRDFYFSKIEFTAINEIGENEENKKVITTTYIYEFYKYNSDVEIAFPSDLANY